MAEQTKHGRTFTGKSRPESFESYSFTLGDEEFELLHGIPAIVYAETTGMITGDNLRFLETCMSDEDVPRFRRQLARKDLIITAELITDIAQYVVEVLTGFPTNAASGSPNGQNGTGDTSMESSSSTAPDGA